MSRNNVPLEPRSRPRGLRWIALCAVHLLCHNAMITSVSGEAFAGVQTPLPATALRLYTVGGSGPSVPAVYNGSVGLPPGGGSGITLPLDRRSWYDTHIAHINNSHDTHYVITSPSLSLSDSLCPGIDRLPVTSSSPGSCLRLSLSNRTTFVGCLLEGVERLPAVLCPQSDICHSMQSPDPRPRARSHLSIFLSPLLAGCSSRQHQISPSHQLNAMFLSSTVCRWQRCSIPRTPGRTVRVDSTPTSACPRGW